MSSNMQSSQKRVSLGSLDLDAVTFGEAVASILDYIANHRHGPPARICSPNAAIVALADEDAAFAEIVRTNNLVVADGLPLVWAALLLRTPLPEQIRGVDLMEAICAAGAPDGLSVYILGGLPRAAELAAERLSMRHPGLQIVGTDCPPIGFEHDSEINRQVRERIFAAGPEFLIVALGSPKQERWIFANHRDLPVGAIQGVGAAIDTLAGLRKRPPAWMRSVGLEWFGRLLHEPGRLWRRYLVGNSRFVWIVLRQWLRSRMQ
jgi:N-acetylglucosaminyldiphosphoundecaprenol N-acetyl-beta-D-mannosaminyltransferase